jgi:hypothetical protein
MTIKGDEGMPYFGVTGGLTIVSFFPQPATTATQRAIAKVRVRVGLSAHRNLVGTVISIP